MESIFALLTAPRDPEAPAVLAPGREPLTHGGLARRIQEITTALRARGIGRADRVAVVLPNGPDLAVALLGIASAAVASPLNPDFQAGEFEILLSDLHAKAVVSLLGGASSVAGAAGKLGIPVFEVAPERQAGVFRLIGEGTSGPSLDGAHPPEECALVFFTSGTTARAKAVPLSAANLRVWARNFCGATALSGKDRCLNMVPLFHAQGLGGAVLPSLAAGGSVVCTAGFHAGSFAAWLAEFRPTWTTAGPTLLQTMIENERIPASHSLRFIRSISAPLTPKLMADLEKAFGTPVLEGYGMTETGTITSNPLPPGVRKPGSVGRSVGPEVMIRAGEILTRGPGLTIEYANDSNATREAFQDGWFRTGDLGHFDEDGYLYISGRVKELINRAGEKVSPGEVEAVLLQHPDVAQAAVFALPHPRMGETVGAVIVPRAGTTPNEKDLKAFVAGKLIEYKVPGRIVMLDEIPKGPTGKIQRIGLAGRLGISAAAASDVPRPAYVAPATPAEVRMAGLWSGLLKVDPVGVHDSFFDLGGDSLQAALLFADIEKATGKKLPLATLAQAPTLRQLTDAVEQRVDDSGWNCLVRLQEGKGRPPFFCVHGLHGNVVGIRGVAALLGSDQPFYALQAKGLNGVEPPLDRVEDMAHAYLEEVLAACPEGPYFLGGFCFGGLVALAMAQQLIQSGRKVGLLAILDSRLIFEPRSEISRGLFLQKEIPGEYLVPNPPGQQSTSLQRAIAEARQIGITPFGPEFRLRENMRAAHRHATLRYTASPFPQRLHLLWTTAESFPEDLRSREIWNRIAVGGLDCVEVACGHLDMLRSPSLGIVAATLRRWLDEVQR